MSRRLELVRNASILAALAAMAAAATTSAVSQTGAPLPPRRPPPLAGPDIPAPPLPQPRPAVSPPAPNRVYGPPMPPLTPAPAPPPSSAGIAAPEDPEVCRRLLGSGKVAAQPMPPVAPTPEGCGMEAPVELSAIIITATHRVVLEPPSMINCALAEAVAEWVRQDLDPAFKAPGPLLAALVGTSGYTCRSRNHMAGAKISEHAHGNALDIGGLRTADGAQIAVTSGDTDRLALIKTTACARFATVLGPGSDGFHEQHMHVDLAPRRHGSKICHWELQQAAHDGAAPPLAAPSWNAGRRGPL